MTSDVVIRSLDTEDWQDVAAIRIEALKIHPKSFFSTYEAEVNRTEAEWQLFLGRSDGYFAGAYAKDVLVGMAGVVTNWEDPHAGIIISNYVRAHYQRQGLSNAMYAACFAWAMTYLPWNTLLVKHREGNEASRLTIKRAGFQFLSKAPLAWPDGLSDDEYTYVIDLEERRRTDLRNTG